MPKRRLYLTAFMKLYYYKDPVGNFGDDLNPFLWEHFLPGVLDEDVSALLVGIGTILNHEVPGAGKKLVFGSGVGYGHLPAIDQHWKFYCVRGPLTAQRLGLDAALAITDPAILIAETPLAPVEPDGSVSFMPHHQSVRHADWRALCVAAGIVYLDPQAPVEQTLAQLRRSKLVIAEAMHGAIVADALRVPWVPVACYDHILDFKWQDWCKSLGLSYQPVKLPGLFERAAPATLPEHIKSEIKHGLRKAGLWSPRWTPPLHRRSSQKEFDAALAALGGLKQKPPAQLSQPGIHREAIERLLEKIDQLKRDVALPGGASLRHYG